MTHTLAIFLVIEVGVLAVVALLSLRWRPSNQVPQQKGRSVENV